MNPPSHDRKLDGNQATPIVVWMEWGERGSLDEGERGSFGAASLGLCRRIGEWHWGTQRDVLLAITLSTATGTGQLGEQGREKRITLKVISWKYQTGVGRRQRISGQVKITRNIQLIVHLCQRWSAWSLTSTVLHGFRTKYTCMRSEVCTAVKIRFIVFCLKTHEDGNNVFLRNVTSACETVRYHDQEGYSLKFI